MEVAIGESESGVGVRVRESDGECKRKRSERKRRGREGEQRQICRPRWRSNSHNIFFCYDTGSGFPLATFLCVLIVPWLWSLPLALMVAELGTAMPDNDGYVLWIKQVM